MIHNAPHLGCHDGTCVQGRTTWRQVPTGVDGYTETTVHRHQDLRGEDRCVLPRHRGCVCLSCLDEFDGWLTMIWFLICTLCLFRKWICTRTRATSFKFGSEAPPMYLKSATQGLCIQIGKQESDGHVSTLGIYICEMIKILVNLFLFVYSFHQETSARSSSTQVSWILFRRRGSWRWPCQKRRGTRKES